MSNSVRARLQKLLATPEPPQLGPGPRPGQRPQRELEAELKSILGDSGLPDDSRALLRALVLLWHDHLDAAHTIAQAIETPDGSLLHAMLHRREPDFWNSKYWWRRVGAHPVFAKLAPRVRALLEARGAGPLLGRIMPGGRWDAGAFVDFCEQPGGQDELLREIQRVEFEAMLDHLAADSQHA